MKTKAAVLYEARTPLEIEYLNLDPPQLGEVLVRVSAAGVCHSDWHIISGGTQYPLPVVLGHEGSGVVEQAGKGVTNLKEGDHVIFDWVASCGSCYYCLNGHPKLCSTYNQQLWAGNLLDGTTRFSKSGKRIFHLSGVACDSEYVVIPQECCVPLQINIPLPVAALIGCAVTTGVGAVLNTAQVRPGSSVAVYGTGGVGICVIMGAQLAGASRIIAVDLNEKKEKMAREFGATHFLVNGPDTNEAVRDLTEGRGADYVFEAVGTPELQEQCLDAARPGGVVILAGLSPMGSSTNLPGALITRQEKTILGSYYGSADTVRDFHLFSDLYLKGRLNLESLISKKYKLEQINQAYADMLSGNIARGLIVFD